MASLPVLLTVYFLAKISTALQVAWWRSPRGLGLSSQAMPGEFQLHLKWLTKLSSTFKTQSCGLSSLLTHFKQCLENYMAEREETGGQR